MEKLFSISEAAEMAGMTSETLRHYDRIGLVKPRRKDDWTGYRYYSRDDIIRLTNVRDSVASSPEAASALKEVGHGNVD